MSTTKAPAFDLRTEPLPLLATLKILEERMSGLKTEVDFMAIWIRNLRVEEERRRGVQS